MSEALTGLEAALAALEKKQLAPALEQLLGAWRACPGQAIADAIDAVSARAATGLTAPTGKTAKARNAAWAEAAEAGDAVMRHVLVATLTDTRGNKQTLERIELLVGDPDPRLSQRIGDFIEDPIYNAGTSRTTKFWRRLFELLAELGDPRLLDRARAWPEAWGNNVELGETERETLGKRLARAMPALKTSYERAAPLGDSERALCAAIIEAVPTESAGERSSAQTRDELLAAIYAAPDDDVPRLVYADFLQEAGDPRGEFIALQIARAAGEASREQKAREKELYAEYRKRWLGELPVLASGAKFERGFLTRCSPRIMTDDPAWSTVVAIARNVPTAEHPMPALREMTDLNSRHIIRLAQRSAPLLVERVEYLQRSGYRSDFANEAEGVAAFEAIRALTSLRELTLGGWVATEMDPAAMAWAWRSPAGARLESLTFPAILTALPAWATALADSSLERAMIWGTTSADGRHGVGATYGWGIELRRDGSGPFDALTLHAPRDIPREDHLERYAAEPLGGIAALAEGTLRTVAIKMPKSAAEMEPLLRERLAAALERQPASL